MSPTTQKFGWKDRDTAARDLLQLVYHAPHDISKRALELLPAIRSPGLVPELLEYIRDEDVWNRDRAIALQAVTLAVGDIYLPELKQHLPGKVNSWTAHTYLFNETVQFVKHHPNNRDWFTEALNEHFAYVDTLSPADQREDLTALSSMYCDSDGLEFPILDRLIHLLEVHPDLLTLYTLLELHRDSRPSTAAWLTERWKSTEDLCVAQGGMLSGQWDLYFTRLVEDWETLRQQLFTAYPNFVAEYESTMGEIEAIRTRNHPPLDVIHAPRWQETESLYKQALDGDKKSRSELKRRLVLSTDMLEKAVAAHFFAKILGSNPEELWRLTDLLNEGVAGWRWSDQWFTQNLEDPDLNVLYTPVQFELGDELRTHPSRSIWNALVNAYFFVGWPHRPYFIDWIAYQTDRLSGLEVEYTGAILAVEDRPWFRALVEREQQAE